MDRRKAVSLFAGVAAVMPWMSVAGQGHSASDQSHIGWVMQVLLEMSRIKPGMTRADLLKVFTTEGGMSSGLRRTFVSRHCPYFKVDVTFEAVGRPNRNKQGVTLFEDIRDKIATISRPYLDFSVMD